MKSFNCSTSACRYCRHYQPEGRRGGMCQQLGVPVRGHWKACSLALAPFAPAWGRIKLVWDDEALGIKEKLTVHCALTDSSHELSTRSNPSNSEQLKAKPALV